LIAQHHRRVDADRIALQRHFGLWQRQRIVRPNAICAASFATLKSPKIRLG
jgi:hypothetical protein